MRRISKSVILTFAAVALLLSVGLIIACGGIEEKRAKDNFDSRVACNDYCTKHFQCLSHTPTSDETSTCVTNCRNSIENNCGNQYQADANKQIETCVDKNCTDFKVCMVFTAAPDCFGFVNE